jgi:hypothetical protein
MGISQMMCPTFLFGLFAGIFTTSQKVGKPAKASQKFASSRRL